VETAKTGEEALEILESTAFDVVITDYKMPCMDGAELIQRIRKGNPNARIILLSGFVDPLGLSEKSTGADVVLPKSCNEAAHLLRHVKRLLSAPARKPPRSQGRPPKADIKAL
jgi:two-component system response regulator YesN